MFGHKLILDTQDFHALKPLFRPTPIDLVLCALFNVIHGPHARYLFIHPSHAFHLFQPASLSRGQAIRIISSRDSLWDIAQNFALNEMEVEPVFIESAYWKRHPAAPIAAPLQSLEPYPESEVDLSPVPEGLPEAFEAQIQKNNSSNLEALLGDDFLNMRAIVFERSSFGQIQSQDLQSLALLNPGCCLLVYICAQDLSKEQVLEKMRQACECGYLLWQLPHFKPLDPKVLEFSPFGKWILLTSAYFT
jgi:hypothetical protein